MKAHGLSLWRYPGWADRKLFEAVRELPEGGYRGSRPASSPRFFETVQGSLNHLLLADRFWFGRFAGEPSGVAGLDGEAESDRQALEAAILRQCEKWRKFLESRPKDRFRGELRYQSASGKAYALPFAETLVHVFKHGTHHRARISTPVFQTGQNVPDLDSLFFLVPGRIG